MILALLVDLLVGTVCACSLAHVDSAWLDAGLWVALAAAIWRCVAVVA